MVVVISSTPGLGSALKKLHDGRARDEVGHGREERLGVVVVHVGIEGRLVAPDLDAEDHVGVGDVGVEAVELAAVVRPEWPCAIAATAVDHLLAAPGRGRGLSDDDQHGDLLKRSVDYG